jgi:hypothetical protein
VKGRFVKKEDELMMRELMSLTWILFFCCL